MSLTAALMVLFTLIGVAGAFTAPIPAAPNGLPFAAGGFVKFAALFGLVISLIFVFLYWKGYGWMRWVVMIYCLFPLLSLLHLSKTMQMSRISGIDCILNALLALFLLYYLNTEPVKAWFNGPKIA